MPSISSLLVTRLFLRMNVTIALIASDNVSSEEIGFGRQTHAKIFLPRLKNFSP